MTRKQKQTGYQYNPPLHTIEPQLESRGYGLDPWGGLGSGFRVITHLIPGPLDFTQRPLVLALLSALRVGRVQIFILFITGRQHGRQGEQFQTFSHRSNRQTRDVFDGWRVDVFPMSFLCIKCNTFVVMQWNMTLSTLSTLLKICRAQCVSLTTM